jgi:hypothetical protein
VKKRLEKVSTEYWRWMLRASYVFKMDNIRENLLQLTAIEGTNSVQGDLVKFDIPNFTLKYNGVIVVFLQE